MRIPGAALLTSLAIVANVGCKDQQKPPEEIIFPAKSFFDGGGAGGYVYMTGTLTGEGIPYKNNTAVIVCYRQRRECLTYSVDQIGSRQIGRLDSPLFYDVTLWNDDEVVASSEFVCSKVTIRLTRKTETALWVVEPINHSRDQCRNADTKALKWTIEDSPAWKDMLGSLNRVGVKP